jgi:hypothetical protein
MKINETDRKMENRNRKMMKIKPENNETNRKMAKIKPESNETNRKMKNRTEK